MSKFFYKGKIEKKPKHASYGFTTNRETRPGTEDAPLALRVASETRKAEIEALLAEHALFAVIDIDAEQAEDITELDALISTPETQRVERRQAETTHVAVAAAKSLRSAAVRLQYFVVRLYLTVFNIYLRSFGLSIIAIFVR